MLISPILTVMSVFRLPGGQLLSRGYVANFSQDISVICNTLPRLTSELPILIVKKTGQNNSSKEFKVCRKRISTLLKYLCSNNPDWIRLNIKYSNENINKLPENGIPNDLNELSDSNVAPVTLDKIINETGPSLLEEEHDIQQFIQTTVDSDIDAPLQVDRINQFIGINWPIIDTIPINEFTYEGLASCAFPSLFPHGYLNFI